MAGFATLLSVVDAQIFLGDFVFEISQQKCLPVFVSYLTPQEQKTLDLIMKSGPLSLKQKGLAGVQQAAQ